MKVNITNKNRKIVIDMLINLVGTGFPIVGLQLIVYPIIAKTIDAEQYGQMQSIMSVVYLISGTFGGTLSTTRLVREYEYKKADIIADFKILWDISLIIVTILTPLVLIFYIKTITPYNLLLITLISIFNYSGSYLEVGLRVRLDYKSIFFNKVLGCAGYLVGYGFFCVLLQWEYIFITSFLFQMLFCARKTGLLLENNSTSILMKDTRSSYINLGIASLFNKALTYFDKLLLYPLLGGEAVSVYYAANIFGKLILQILEPITNVILSYLSKSDKVSFQTWKITVGLASLFCGFMYFVCLLISRPVLTFFYPQWVDAAMQLVPVATLSLCVSSFVNILYPLTLKEIDANKQVVINASGLIVYIFFALEMYTTMGLIGCCWALLLSYIIKLPLIFAFCRWRRKEDDKRRKQW